MEKQLPKKKKIERGWGWRWWCWRQCSVLNSEISCVLHPGPRHRGGHRGGGTSHQLHSGNGLRWAEHHGVWRMVSQWHCLRQTATRSSHWHHILHPACRVSTEDLAGFWSFFYFIFFTYCTGIACSVEHQTHDQNVVSSNLGRSSGTVFFFRVNFLCRLLVSVPPLCYCSCT